MRTQPRAVTILIGLMLLVGVNSRTQAASNYTIYYQTNNLVDLIAGQDLWQYQYLVSGPSFLQDQGFNIQFSTATSQVTALSTVNYPHWDIITYQPESALPSPHDGAFDALALIDNPSLSDWFLVSFLWQGSGTPGAQPFTIYDTDFSTLETGETVAYNPGTSIPEPATAILLVSGLFHLARRRMQHQI